MKNDIKYRIREYCGAFEIQVLGYKEKGMLWWKRKEWDWYRTNAWGGIIKTFPIVQPFSKKFKTLKAAKKQINKWNKDTNYHQL